MPLISQPHEKIARVPTFATEGDLSDLDVTRRGLLLASLLAALPAALSPDPAHAIDPNQTQVTLPDQYKWKPGLLGAPAQSVETVPVFGAPHKPGLYVVLIRWHPGYMSAPHTYVTDRLCFVISTTWWVNSGGTFEPESTVPVPAGGFVRRVAYTPHYDGVRKDGYEPPSLAFSARLLSSSNSSIRPSRRSGRYSDQLKAVSAVRGSCPLISANATLKWRAAR
jgi:hypothetical protein